MDVRVRIIFLCGSVIGLLFLIEGLLNGPWWRIPVGALWTWAFTYVAIKGPGILVPQKVKDGLAEQMAQASVPSYSVPLIFGGVLLALTFAFVAGLFLFAPWDVLLDLFSSRRSNWPGFLRDMGGEWFARIALAAVSLVAAGAAGYTTLVRIRDR